MEHLTDGYVLENPVGHIAIFAAILVFGLLMRGIISRLISGFGWQLLQQPPIANSKNEFIRTTKGPIRLLVTLLVLYTSFSFLKFPDTWGIATENEFGIKMLLSRGFGIASIIAVTLILVRVIDFFGSVYYYRIVDNENKLGQQLYPFTRELLKILVVIFSFFFTLGTVFGLNVANLIAGMGIGGLAVALAAKETLENLFASFTIFLDKPFSVGDFVTAGSVKGTIEKVGFRSTRIRTIDRSFVTLPNKMMVDQAVDNLSLRTSQRVKFSFNLPFGVSPEAIVNIVTKIKTWLDENPNTGEAKDALVGFNDFYENGIRITVIYYLNTLELQKASHLKEEINLQVLKIVKAEGVEFLSNIVTATPGA